MTNDTLRHALAYAARGWPVFPCQPGQKIPATSHGYRDATTSPRQITEWFTRHPGRNLAIATGTPGPDVLDRQPAPRRLTGISPGPPAVASPRAGRIQPPASGPAGDQAPQDALRNPPPGRHAPGPRPAAGGEGDTRNQRTVRPAVP